MSAVPEAMSVSPDKIVRMPEAIHPVFLICNESVIDIKRKTPSSPYSLKVKPLILLMLIFGTVFS
jgi:hypothetical protein